MRRAAHVVQIKYLDDFRGSAGKYDAPAQQWNPNPGPTGPQRRRLEGDIKLIIMEYCELGSLEHWLRRTNRSPAVNRWSNEALWRLWTCLVKGCIAMKYPPMRPPFANGLPPPRTGPPIDEQLPNPPVPAGNASCIHFDIDPGNILVGDFDAGDHATIPPFKVGGRT